MAITIGRSTDAGAPTLSNTAGSLIAVLDWFLRDQLGWAKASLGTNRASYRAPSGNRFYLQVDDTATDSGRVTGWETLTAFNTGTGQFPTNAQYTNGQYVPHNQASNAYRIYSNGVIVYFYLWNNGASTTNGFYFGDFASYKSGDAFNTLMFAESGSNPGGSATMPTYVNTTSQLLYWLARSHTQTGGSVQASQWSDYARMNGTGRAGLGGLPYPCPIDGGLHMAPVWIFEGGERRGFVPGVWVPMHARPLTDGAKFTASSGPLSGRSFEVIDFGSSGGQLFVETSDTWGGLPR